MYLLRKNTLNNNADFIKVKKKGHLQRVLNKQ